MPTLAGELDGMDAQAARFKPPRSRPTPSSGRKAAPPASSSTTSGSARRSSSRRAQLGVRNIAVHKGLAFGPRGYEFSTSRDIGPAAKRPSRHELPRSTTPASTPA
jgi:hypothetical protein